MDHFALPDDDLAQSKDAGAPHRNFMGYTTHAECDLVGLGLSAISHIGDSYSQSPRDLPAREFAVESGRLPVAFPEYFAASWPELQRLAGEGLVVLNRQRVAASSQGRYLSRIIAMCFDRYLIPQCTSSDEAEFSKVV